MHLANYVDEVLAHCEVCRAYDKAPRVPIAGTSTVSMRNEKLQAGLPSSDHVVALHAMDGYSKSPLSIPARSGNPQKVRGAFCDAWIGRDG